MAQKRRTGSAIEQATTRHFYRVKVTLPMGEGSDLEDIGGNKQKGGIGDRFQKKRC